MTLRNYTPGSIIQLFWILASLTGLALKANLSYQNFLIKVNNSLRLIFLYLFPGFLRLGVADHCILQLNRKKVRKIMEPHGQPVVPKIRPCWGEPRTITVQGEHPVPPRKSGVGTGIEFELPCPIISEQTKVFQIHQHKKGLDTLTLWFKQSKLVPTTEYWERTTN